MGTGAEASWRTLFNEEWENVVFAFEGLLEGDTGSNVFRKAKFDFWIGYDF